MPQDDAAKHLGVSRPTFVQIEAGNRSVSSLELDKLAYLFGRDIREFVTDVFHEEDSLTALFRAQPAVVGEPAVLDKLRECMALGRELTNLERVVGIDRDPEPRVRGAGARTRGAHDPRATGDARCCGQRWLMMQAW